MGDDQRLDSNQITVFGNNVNDIVNLSTVSSNLAAYVVRLVVMTDKRCQCILSNGFGNTETKHYVHLGEITVEFLLGHFIDTPNDVFV